VQEVKHVKEAMARQAKKEVASLKKKLEVAEQKAKDAAVDLQTVVEGKFAWSLSVEPMHLLSLSLIFRPWMGSDARETEGTLNKEHAKTKDQVTVLKERTAEVQRGEWSCLS
jgi:hypothetical protein